jgi:hypothetical protein
MSSRWPWPTSTDNCRRRLGLSRENYRRLIEFLDNPKDAKLLRNHVHVEITDSSIDVLYEVPASLRSVVVAVLGYIPRLESFADGLRLLVARGAASNLDALIADLVIHRQPGQFIGRVKHLVAALPLPEGLPPAQIGKARRLDRVEEVTRLAKAWKNCLANYTSQIDRGECAVYLWDDPAGRAACYVRRAGRLGWALHRPLGPRNSELEPEQLACCWGFPLTAISKSKPWCRSETSVSCTRARKFQPLWPPLARQGPRRVAGRNFA